MIFKPVHYFETEFVDLRHTTKTVKIQMLKIDWCAQSGTVTEKFIKANQFANEEKIFMNVR